MPGVVYKISGDNSQFQKDINESESIAAGGFNKMSALGIAAWAAIGAAVVKAVSAGVDFLKDSVNVGMGFDKSMSQVAATMGTTVDDIQDLSNFAMEMGATTAFSAQQAADGLNILAQSGLSATEQMATLPEVLNLAASGGLDLATASKYVTGAVKGYGDSFNNASKYTNMIAKGASLANTDVNMLGLALSSSAATAKSYGQSAEETTLSLLRLAEQNVTGSEAAQALNRAMMDLYTPTEAAKKAMDKLGVSAYDSTGKARPFNEVIKDLDKSLVGMSDAEANATKNAIFSTYGLQAYNKMVVSSDDSVQKFTTAIKNSTGAAEQMAKVQLDNLAGDLTLAQSASEGLKISLSNSLTPAIRDIVQTGTEELGKLKEAFEEGGWRGLGEQFALSAGEMISKIGEYIPQVLSAAIEFGKGLTDGFAQGLGLKAKAIEESEAVKTTLSEIQTSVDETKSDLEGMKTALSDVDTEYNQLQNWVTVFEDLSSKTKLTKDEELLLKTAIEALNSVLPDTQQIVQDETGKWVANTSEIKKNIEQLRQRAKAEALQDYTKKLYQDIWDLQQKRVQAEKDLNEAQSHQDEINQQLVHHKVALAEISDALKDVDENTLVWQSSSFDVQAVWDKMPDSVKQFAKEMGIETPQTVQDLMDIKAGLEDVLYGSAYEGSNLQDMYEQSKKDTETLQEGIDQIDTTIEETKAAMNAAIDDIYNSGAEAGDAYADGLGSKEETVKLAAQRLRDVAKSGVAADLYTEGLNAAQGLASGLSAGQGSVSVAAQGLASAVRSGVTKKLMIKSPSRVMMEVGEFATEGLALGIEDEDKLNMVRRASERAAGESIAALTSSLDSSISAPPVTGTENGQIDTIVTLLTTYLPNIGSDIVLDTGELVGRTIGATDRELGILQMRRAKYE